SGHSYLYRYAPVADGVHPGVLMGRGDGQCDRDGDQRQQDRDHDDPDDWPGLHVGHPDSPDVVALLGSRLSGDRWHRNGDPSGVPAISRPGLGFRHTEPMRVGAGLDAGLRLTFEELRQAGREAARLGFESLWTPAGGVPDAFHICAAWADDTPLWTGIS